MEVLITSAYCLLFYLIITKNSFFRIETYSWMPGVFFLLKCISGIILGLLYLYYYKNHEDADSFKFFTDSKIMFDTLYYRPYDFFRMLTGIGGSSHDLRHYYMEMNSWLNTNTLYNDNRTIVRLNAFFRFVSGGFYNVHVILINFISFSGLFCLYKTFIRYCHDRKTELFVLTFLMPSVMFWGSGLLKDGLLIAGFGIFIFSFSQLLNNGITLRRILFFVTGLAILVLTKVYVIVILLPGLLAWLFSRKMNSTNTIWTFIIFYSVYLISAFSIYRFKDEYNVAAEIFYKQRNFIELGEYHHASMIAPVNFECSGTSILKNSPKAFINTFGRPFLTDVHSNPMILLSAAENLLLCFLVLAMILFLRRPPKESIPFLLLSIYFVLLLFILIGLITPILGAMVRYRIIALPSLAFILVALTDKKKLISKLPFLKRPEKVLSR